ncbi:Mitochondrial FAD-linked sulfhydryl oxidase [Lachnellula subtilissima]|uniref:Sulfhydryl oxidase n=1 Tax=Lachnellula subtilissima TaxID=602034 RepID=A0A8H8UF56_9HELO|nr:Mitochondrial FAD-linked sulfhydryl oxidase [Lachnellula subtilissima]
MTEETQESGSGGTTTTTATPTSAGDAKPPRKKRIVLGKDGKPCRTCNSLADFTSQRKTITKPSAPPKECPPDVEELGRSSWTLLHSITATYPEAPTPNDQSNVKQFLGLFGKLYPCWVCAEDFQVFMERNKVRAESRDEFGMWMCEAHNDVNRKLGKKEFDCAKWEERWRTGWKDGRCD